MTVTVTNIETVVVDPATGLESATVTYDICVQSVGTQVCDLSHLDLILEGDISCLTLDSPAPWVIGPDPSATACNGGQDVIKYDDGLPADGNPHCVQLIVTGGRIACGDAVIKGGNACITVHDLPVPTCDPSWGLDPDPCDDDDPCDPEQQGWTLTQGGWGSAGHYEALACDIIATCPEVAADIAYVADCYGYDPAQDLGAWVTGDCGGGTGPDGGFLPSGFNPGENGGSQLIAALLSIDGVACYGLDRVGGDPVDAVGRDWIVLSTGQTVGEVLDAAMATCGAGFADILGEINESWDEGFDIGTVSPCPR
jgi:hypothetical protein